MNNYEKVVFASGNVYDIVPGGLRATDEALTMVLLPGNKNLMQVDAETDDATNTATIQIQDSTGDTMDVKKGYVYQTECRKIKDYVIGREPVGEVAEGETSAEAPAESVEQEYRDITGTVISVTLKKQDLRRELEAAKEEIRSLNATVDMLVIKELEG